jgi:hypothetical protein
LPRAVSIALEPGARPGIAPAPFRRDLLEGHHEVVGFGETAVDIIGAKDGTPHFEAFVELIAAFHAASS